MSDLDDMFEEMRVAEDAANRRVTPGQRQVGFGDCWVSYNAEWDLWIFGELQSEADYKASVLDEVPERYHAETLENAMDVYRRGYRTGKAYSVACDYGEIGDTHVSTMLTRLTPEQFADARSANWSMGQLVESEIGWATALSMAVLGAGELSAIGE